MIKHNKKLLLILVPGVLSIWGVIAYRVVNTIGNSDHFEVKSESLIALPPDTIRQEKYVLSLQYDEPFQISEHQKTQAQKTKAKKTEKPKVVKKVTPLPIKWPDIVFKGVIESENEGALYMIMIDKEIIFMEKGGAYRELTLKLASIDSVQFAIRDEKRIFKKQ